MLITWDEPKRRSNLVKHGLDFARFETGFDFEGAVRYPARPSRTGRQRFIVVGELDGEIVVLAVVSPLGTEALSLVSLRRATEAERRRYGF